ncbi:glycosyl hydrolase family 28-related protein, partial [Liquorilactobacillus hordei]|uniref:glycosyl hydrolase family 28-related protein n=1 Tax=Liquorilactobacillus hordei TaxID=468911 RepID=UPI0039EB0C93
MASDTTENNFPADYNTAEVDSRVSLRSKSVRNKVYGKDVREALAQGIEISSAVSSEAKKIAADAKKQSQNIDDRFNDQVAGTTNDNEIIDFRHSDMLEKSYTTAKLRGDFWDNELSQRGINVKWYGAVGDGLTDDTTAIQKAFDVASTIKELLYFPAGSYMLSSTITLPNYVNVICNKNCEIFWDKNYVLKSNEYTSAGIPMFKSTYTLDLNSYVEQTNELFSWIGGNINGYGLEHMDNSKTNYWNTGAKIIDGVATTTWNHDFQRAFLILGYENVYISHITIKDIVGHGIGYYGNNNFTFVHSEINQGIDDVNYPNGGSRRDGCSGSSTNIYIDDIKVFADDDAFALVSGLDWGFGKCDINKVRISRIELLENNGHHCYRLCPVYGNSSVEMDSIFVFDISGTVEVTPFTNVGSGNISIFLANNLNLTLENSNHCIYTQIRIDSLSITNFIFEELSSDMEASVVSLAANVGSLRLDGIFKAVNATNTTELGLIKLNTSNYPENVSGNVQVKASSTLFFDEFMQTGDLSSNLHINTTLEIIGFELTSVINAGASDNILISNFSKTVYQKISCSFKSGYSADITQNTGLNISYLPGAIQLSGHIIADSSFLSNADTNVMTVKIKGTDISSISDKIFLVVTDKTTTNGGHNGYAGTGSTFGKFSNGNLVFSIRDTNVRYAAFMLLI